MKNLKISSLIKIAKHLEKLNCVENIVDTSTLFFDEPKFFSYSLLLKNIQNTNDLKGQPLGGAGVSFSNRKIALIKCISEAIERISLFTYKKTDLIHSNYKNLIIKNNYALDPKKYLKEKKTDSKLFTWIKGTDLIDNKSILIPAQLAFLGYGYKKEPYLTQPVSTGAAGGFCQKSILLRGIYELVERDALMTIYLAQIKTQRIDLKNIKDRVLKSIINTFNKYRLQLMSFDITNDLQVPTFLTLIKDPTAIGPLLSVGYKSNLNPKIALIGSMEEAFMGRTATRYNIYKQKGSINQKKNLSDLEKLRFLMNQSGKTVKVASSSYQNKSVELKTLIFLLSKQNIKLYYVDITNNQFKSFKHFVYRVISPDLQPYLINNMKEIKSNRLKNVAKYFGKKLTTLGSLPHPFL